MTKYLLLLPEKETLSTLALSLAFILFFLPTIAAFLQLAVGWKILNFSTGLAACIELGGAWMSCSLLARLHALGA